MMRPYLLRPIKPPKGIPTFRVVPVSDEEKARMRQLYEAGNTPTSIQRLLFREFGHDRSLTTATYWAKKEGWKRNEQDESSTD